MNIDWTQALKVRDRARQVVPDNAITTTRIQEKYPEYSDKMAYQWLNKLANSDKFTDRQDGIENGHCCVFVVPINKGGQND